MRKIFFLAHFFLCLLSFSAFVEAAEYQADAQHIPPKLRICIPDEFEEKTFPEFCKKQAEGDKNNQKVNILFSYFQQLLLKKNNPHTPHSASEHMDLEAIRPWIISTKNPSHMVSLSVISALFSTRSGENIEETFLEAYLQESCRVSQQTFDYRLLKEFAREHCSAGTFQNENEFDSFFISPTAYPVVLPKVEGFQSMPVPCHTPLYGNTAELFSGVVKEFEANFLEMLAVRLNLEGHKDALSEQWKVFQEQEAQKRDKVFYSRCVELFLGQMGITTPGMMSPTEQPESLMLFDGMEKRQFQVFNSAIRIKSLLEQKIQSSLATVLDRINQNENIRYQHPFLVCTQSDGDESASYPISKEKIRQETEVQFKDGQVVRKGIPLTTGEIIWAMNLDGVMCTSFHPERLDFHHSFFFHKEGVGQPIACGGHMTLLNGKITKINNCSGHYSPTPLHLAFAVKALNNHNVFFPDVSFEGSVGGLVPTLQGMLFLANSLFPTESEAL